MVNTLIFILLSLSSLSYAIPEEHYTREMRTKALPYFNRLSSHHFINHQGLSLHYRKLIVDPAGPTLVISPGRTEHTRKYAELVYDLRDLKMNIFILDHQGQGESERLNSDPHLGHVRYFKDYEMDFAQWINEEVLPQVNPNEVHLLAHSMGSAIAIRFEARHPTFKRIILSAPMFKINTSPYSEMIARIYSAFLVRIGKGEEYAPGKTPYRPEDDLFKSNEVTHSEPRFDMNKSFFKRYPDLALGGASARWVSQSLKATKNIHKLGPKVSAPIVIFQAGDDRVVINSRQSQFCALAPRCNLVHFPEAFHEVLMESDSIREKAINRLRLHLTFNEED